MFAKRRIELCVRNMFHVEHISCFAVRQGVARSKGFIKLRSVSRGTLCNHYSHVENTRDIATYSNNIDVFGYKKSTFMHM